MTLITPEQDIAELEELFASIRSSIGILRREIESLKERAEAGEEINETTAAKSIRSVNGLVSECQKAELKLYDCRNLQAGIVRGGYALDLDGARDKIGCQLDRLRCTYDTGKIPE